MESDDLRLTLIQLRADLENSAFMDPQTRQSLELLQEDIQRRLEQQEGQEHVDAGSAMEDGLTANEGGLAARAQEMSARFAAEHPRLEPVLRELGAILERIGI